MPIFDTNSSAAQNAANQVLNFIRNQFNSLSMSGRNGFNVIWKNRNATPQEVVTALGTNAKAVFDIAALNISTIADAAKIAGVDVPSLPSIPDNYVITFANDGSGTVMQLSSSLSGTSSSSSSASEGFGSSSSSSSVAA